MSVLYVFLELRQLFMHLLAVSLFGLECLTFYLLLSVLQDRVASQFLLLASAYQDSSNIFSKLE